MANDVPADDVVGIDARLAAVKAAEPKAATSPKPWEPGYGAEPTVVREESWLDKVQHKLRVSAKAISGIWNDFWNSATDQAGDQGEALGKASIPKRPPSENTRTKQAVAEALASGQDATAAEEARRIAQQADVAGAARQDAGDFGRVSGVASVAVAREGVSAYGQAKALQAIATVGGAAVGAVVSSGGGTGLDVRRRIGVGGRVESAFARLEAQHLRTGTGTTAASRSTARAAGYASDDAGHVIGRLLGGRGGTGYVIPQSPTINRGAFRAFEAEVAREVQAGREVFVRVTPRYAGNATRPLEIVYQVRVDGQTRTVVFPNP